MITIRPLSCRILNKTLETIFTAPREVCVGTEDVRCLQRQQITAISSGRYTVSRSNRYANGTFMVIGIAVGYLGYLNEAKAIEAALFKVKRKISKHWFFMWS